MERGIFITLEGILGSGKTIQSERLAETLSEEGRVVTFVREPGSTDAGEEIRKILLYSEGLGLKPLTEVFLFEASRHQLVEEKIWPALERGEIVVSDRFFDSTTVFQGYGWGLLRGTIMGLNRLATNWLVPDLTLLLDLPAEVGMARKSRSEDKDRLDRQRIDFHQRIRDGYLELAGEEPLRWRVINADRPIEDVWQDVWTEVSSFLAGRTPEGTIKLSPERGF